VSRPDFVAGVDFGGTKVALATATLDGEVIERARLDTDALRGAHQAVRRTVEAAAASIARTERDSGGRCVAAGVVSPGIVFADRVELAPNVPGWGELALERLMREGLGVDCVAVGNDVRAAGLAESRRGALRGADPALYLSLGTGVAAAVVVGGEVLQGAHGAAGEIGYSLRGVDERNDFSAGRAPLEEIAGGRFIGLRASELTGAELTAAQAFAAQEPPLRELVDRALDELALHVANLALLIDPQRVAVGGGMMASADRVLGALGRRLARALPFPPQLVCARFVHDAALRGAVALAIEASGSAR
jgi:glucokinase